MGAVEARAGESKPKLLGGIEAPLSGRLAVLTAGRLVFVVIALALVALVYLRDSARDLGGFTVQVALWTGMGVLLVTVLYAVVLMRARRRLSEDLARSGTSPDQTASRSATQKDGFGTQRGLRTLAAIQLIFDQGLWTVVVYLTGAASSGATSLYGITCLAGGLLLGLQGAVLASVSGGLFFYLMIVLLHSGGLPKPSDQPARLYELTAEETAYYLVVNVLVLLVVTLLVGYLVDRLRRAGGRLEAAEERAHQAERMAALGRLAAGLAHEIRNPLSSIAGSVQLLRETPHLGEEDRELCSLIDREANRLNELVTDMLVLARPRKPDLREVDISNLAREVVHLASRSGRGVSDVQLLYQGPSESLWVKADPQQCRQLLWNLVRNAVQASSAGQSVRTNLELVDDRVVLTIEDDGVGIDPATVHLLYDAFFTTRSQGTGVGLAVVKRIADEHGFHISVDTNRPRGAAFRVDLGPPLSHAPARSDSDRVLGEAPEPVVRKT